MPQRPDAVRIAHGNIREVIGRNGRQAPGIIIRIAPAKVRGAIVGFVVLAINLAGYGLGTQLTGIMSDIFAWTGATQPLRWALCSVTIVFSLSGVLYCLAGRRLDAVTRQ